MLFRYVVTSPCKPHGPSTQIVGLPLPMVSGSTQSLLLLMFSPELGELPGVSSSFQPVLTLFDQNMMWVG